MWSLCIEPGYVNGFVIGPTEIIKSSENDITKIKSKLNKSIKSMEILKIFILLICQKRRF